MEVALLLETQKEFDAFRLQTGQEVTEPSFVYDFLSEISVIPANYENYTTLCVGGYVIGTLLTEALETVKSLTE